MNRLLRIDASIRTRNSSTRTLTDYFQTLWQEKYPAGTVIHRCLARDPVPHISAATVDAFHNTSAEEASFSDRLVEELMSVDHLVIGSPLYNLNLHSSLKAYFDHIVRMGVTFRSDNGKFSGLLGKISATLITARGGNTKPGIQDDFQTNYLRSILAFIGITRVDIVGLEGTAVGEEAENARQMSIAKKQLDLLFDKGDPARWRGEFSDTDKVEIRRLRQGQADAIVRGDYEAYAELCTPDIQLLIPSQDMISGRNAFLEAEKSLFAKAGFIRFEKFPEVIERSGDLAVETGRQEIGMENSGNIGGVFSTRQKYTHVFRKTPEGWRFAVLMSNPSE